MKISNQKKGVWKPFFHLLKITKLPILWILFRTIFTLGRTQLELLFPSYTQKITAGDVSTATIVTMVAVVIGQALLTGFSQSVNAVTEAKISLSFRKSVWGRILHLPVTYYDTHMPREMINRVTQDTTLLSNMIAALPGSLISGLYSLIATFFILFSYDWRLVVIELGVCVLMVLCGLLEGYVRYKTNDNVQARIADLAGFLAEILLHIPLVKTFVREKYEDERGDQCIEELYRTNFKYSILSSSANTLSNTVHILNTVVAVAAGAALCSKDIITVDIWIAFYLYSRNLLTNVASIMSLWSGLKAAQGAARRISEISDEPFENYEGRHYKPEQANLFVKDVSFAYEEKEVLKHISLEIPQGRTTAFVGPSGSGKSTLLNLFERFYAPTEGVIVAGTENIQELNLKEWRGSIGYVAQDTLLFSGTIRENMLYGVNREVSEEEFQKVAKEACITEFVQNMENGYETEVGEGGSKLSGGQRQRIGIARALLGRPNLLLLDEVTANLDLESEIKVLQAIRNASVGRTTIMVAHRLDTVRDADQIVVMEKGKVLGTGIHEELMKQSGLYRQMVESQREDRKMQVAQMGGVGI